MVLQRVGDDSATLTFSLSLQAESLIAFISDYHFNYSSVLSLLYDTGLTSIHDYWDSNSDSMHMSLSTFSEIVDDRGAWHAAVHGLQRVGHK